ncbi:MAG: hypothetical protein JO075_02925, partial [Acidimicrobiia bacterium]|nr:hypothetical protein [Acidimicrobiia bacterium]
NEISFTDDFEGHNVVINGKIFAGPMLPQNGKPTEKPTSPVPRWGVSVTTPEDGEVWVTGSIVAGTGMNGAELRPAGTGGQVKLGGFLGPDAKVTVASTAVVQAGDGGRGVSDQTGKHVSGSTSCLVPTKGPHFIVPNRSTLVLTGTDGGDGGALRIWSRDISVQSDQVTPGAGGNGGNVQSLYGRIKAPDGTTGESGWNIDATSGSGGAGGGIDLRYSKTYSGGTLRPGRGGDAGSVNVAAGDGAPHCDGGQTEVHLGSPGAAGTDSTDTGTKLPPKGKPKPGSITLEGGGNGGPSTDAKHGGGNGGGVLIKDPSGAVGTFRVERYGDGGVGFDGCKVKPVTAGTDGGNGAELGPAGLPFTATDSFNGENAGDGNPPGARPGGHQRPEPIGKFVNSFGSGSFGKQCPGTLATPPKTSTTPATNTSYTCGGPETKILDTSNGFAVEDDGTAPSFSTNGKAYCVVQISTYHWNDGDGEPPGTIALESGKGTLGKWPATGSVGEPDPPTYPNGVPNANWTVTFSTSTKPVVIDGTYKCVDSDPSTWSQNEEPPSKGQGFCKIWVVPAKPAG